MRAVQSAKVVLAVAGLAVFMLGVQNGQDILRYVGISLVVVAWLLRFIKPQNSPEKS
jgi:protein-S-isoprenylcysteine O-methyltransferase Ste14